jgi:hypothetical protein
MVSLKVHLHGVHINYRDSLKVVDVWHIHKVDVFRDVDFESQKLI